MFKVGDKVVFKFPGLDKYDGGANAYSAIRDKILVVGKIYEVEGERQKGYYIIVNGWTISPECFVKCSAFKKRNLPEWG